VPLVEMHIKRKFRGTSAEAKPTTGVSVGDEWVNTDTGETFVWTGTEWKATALPQLLFGLASFYIDDVLIADEGITGSTKLKAGTITKDRLATDTIRLEIPVPLGYIPTSLATDSTGVKFETKQYLVSSDLLACAKAAYFETDLQQLTGGTVAIELYDYTAATVRTSISLSATTKRSRSGDIKASLVAGNPVGVRFNCVTAGASGSVGGGASPVLIVVIGIS
jgi:hypothetical protein